MSCSSFFRRKSRKLEQLEALLSAFIVVHVEGPLRLTDCARNKAELLSFFLTKFLKPLLPRDVVLLLSSLHTYHRSSFLQWRFNSYRLLPSSHFAHDSAGSVFPSSNFIEFWTFLFHRQHFFVSFAFGGCHLCGQALSLHFRISRSASCCIQFGTPPVLVHSFQTASFPIIPFLLLKVFPLIS